MKLLNEIITWKTRNGYQFKALSSKENSGLTSISYLFTDIVLQLKVYAKYSKIFKNPSYISYVTSGQQNFLCNISLSCQLSIREYLSLLTKLYFLLHAYSTVSLRNFDSQKYIFLDRNLLTLPSTLKVHQTRHPLTIFLND